MKYYVLSIQCRHPHPIVVVKAMSEKFVLDLLECTATATEDCEPVTIITPVAGSDKLYEYLFNYLPWPGGLDELRRDKPQVTICEIQVDSIHPF